MHTAALVVFAALAALLAGFGSVDDAIVVGVVTGELFAAVFQGLFKIAHMVSATVLALASAIVAQGMLQRLFLPSDFAAQLEEARKIA